MTTAIDLLSALCLAGGAFFSLVGGIGLVRMPDFYTRMHAASVTDTLGAGLILTGLMLQAGWTLIAAKLAMVGLLTLLANPTATHALAKAAMLSGLKPRLGAHHAAPQEPLAPRRRAAGRRQTQLRPLNGCRCRPAVPA